MKIYDVIKIGNEEYVLTLVERTDIRTGKVAAIGRRSFNRWTEAVWVQDFTNISEDEMRQIATANYVKLGNVLEGYLNEK